MNRPTHQTLGAMKNAEVGQAYAEFATGARVQTVDGFPGRVEAVLTGPYPQTETYEVRLDNGLGGGEYTARQLRPLTGRTAAAEEPMAVEASEVHLASEDYPELGTILYDRPPNERVQVYAGLQATAAFDWDELECTACGGTGEQGKYYCPACGGTGKRADQDPSIVPQYLTEPPCTACSGTGEQGTGHECYQCDGSGSAVEQDPTIDNANPGNGLPVGRDDARGIQPVTAATVEEIPPPSACSWCGHDQFTNPTNTGRGLRMECAQCGGTMTSWGGQWQPDMTSSPENHPRRDADSRAVINDPAVVHASLTADSWDHWLAPETAATWRNFGEKVLARYDLLNTGDPAAAAVAVDPHSNPVRYLHQLYQRQANWDPELGFHLIATWAEVREKAKQIKDSGGVRILAASAQGVVGEVQGEHALYESAFNYVPGTRKLADWNCGCKWGAYAWGRSPAYRRFEGRKCSHVTALQFEAQSRGMFGQDVGEDRQRLPGQYQRSPVTVQYERPTERADGGNINRRSVPPGNMRRTYARELDLAPVHVFAREMAQAGDTPDAVLTMLANHGVAADNALRIVRWAVTGDDDGGSTQPGQDIPGITTRDTTEFKKRPHHHDHHTNDTRRHAPDFGRGIGWLAPGLMWCDQCNGSGCGHCGGTGQVMQGVSPTGGPGVGDLSTTTSPIADEDADAGEDVSGGISTAGALEPDVPVQDGVWYHGSRHTLQPGQILTGGHAKSNQGYGQPGEHVYYTGRHDVASAFAEAGYGPDHRPDAKPKVYTVEPIEGHEPDPDEPEEMHSYRARSVRVLNRVRYDHDGPRKIFGSRQVAPVAATLQQHQWLLQHYADASTTLMGGNPAPANNPLTPHSDSRNPGSTGWGTSADPHAWTHPIINNSYEIAAEASARIGAEHGTPDICGSCGEHIRASYDPSTPWVHTNTQNAFCDVHDTNDAVLLAGSPLERPEARPMWHEAVAEGQDSLPEYTHAGVAVKAADTGRVLMIQRSFKDDKDPAKGTWEFPGGGKEEGDQTSLHTGIREWQEEVGQPFPEGGHVSHTWRAGTYHGHVVTIPTEGQVDFSQGRSTTNPDDPDGDDHEQAAWWDPQHAKKNPALREELKKDNPFGAIEKAAEWNYTPQDMDSAPDDGPIIHPAGTKPPRRLRPGDTILWGDGSTHVVNAATYDLLHVSRPDGRFPKSMHRGPIEGNSSGTIEGKEGAERLLREKAAAISTPCQTPEVVYDTTIGDRTIGVTAEMPMDVNLDAQQANTLDRNLHNMMEMALAPLFPPAYEPPHKAAAFLTMDQVLEVARAEERRTGKSSEQLLREHVAWQEQRLADMLGNASVTAADSVGGNPEFGTYKAAASVPTTAHSAAREDHPHNQVRWDQGYSHGLHGENALFDRNLEDSVVYEFRPRAPMRAYLDGHEHGQTERASFPVHPDTDWLLDQGEQGPSKYSTLHEPSEPALPSTDGAVEDDPEANNSGWQPGDPAPGQYLSAQPDIPWGYPGGPSDPPPLQISSSLNDVPIDQLVASFQATAVGRQLAADAATAPPTELAVGDGRHRDSAPPPPEIQAENAQLAAIAQAVLAGQIEIGDNGITKSAMKDFDLAEQQDLITEGANDGTLARNFGGLQIEGTHYALLDDPEMAGWM